MKILFLGSPNFAKTMLESLVQDGHEIVAVICQPDRPADRGGKMHMPEAKIFALENGIKVLQFEKVNQHIDEIKKLKFDVFVTASFGQILSSEFLALGLGLNVHPSLLPKLRGATPIQTALMQNLKSTGVTIQRMVKEMDAGEILEQQEVQIAGDDDYASLEKKLAEVACRLLKKALKKVEDGSAVFRPQIGEPTFTKLIKKEDGFLDFNLTAKQLFGKVRALSHNPGCYFFLDGNRIKVTKAAAVACDCQPQTVLSGKKRLLIGCNEGALEILELVAPSGKRMSGASFLNGYHGAWQVN